MSVNRCELCPHLDILIYGHKIGQSSNVMIVYQRLRSVSGAFLPWLTEIKYLGLGVHIVESKSFKISTDQSRGSFYRAASTIFGRVGRIASEEVVLHLMLAKCIPILLYGFEACPIRKTDLTSLDLVVNRFLNETVQNWQYRPC